MGRSIISEEELEKSIKLNGKFEKDMMNILLFLISQSCEKGKVMIVKLMNTNVFEGLEGFFQSETIISFFEEQCSKLMTKTYESDEKNIFKKLEVKFPYIVYEFESEFIKECGV